MYVLISVKKKYVLYHCRASGESTPLCFAITEASGFQALTDSGLSFYSRASCLVFALFDRLLWLLAPFSHSVSLAIDLSKIGVNGLEANIVGGAIHS